MAVKEADTSAAGDDVGEITDLMNRYFEAVYNGDVEALRDVFHPQNRLAGMRGDEERFSSLEQFLERVTSRPNQDAFDFQVLSVDQSGRAAVAKISYRYHGVDFVDYMSVLRLEGSWRIVAKVFDGYLIPEND